MATHNKIQLTIKQVYLPAIKGYVPDEMVKALWAFSEFCYIAQHNIHDMQSINELEDVLQCYHHHRKIFLDTGVWTGFNLPHQHALIHYAKAIHLFGSPNGLCSSITLLPPRGAANLNMTVFSSTLMNSNQVCVDWVLLESGSSFPSLWNVSSTPVHLFIGIL